MYQPHQLVTWVVIGLVAGALAGVAVRGKGFGCLGDIVIGVVGALVGGAAMHKLVPGERVGFLGSILVAFLGAALLVYILELLRPGTRNRPGLIGRGRGLAMAPVGAATGGLRLLTCGPFGCLIIVIAIALVIGITELAGSALPQ